MSKNMLYHYLMPPPINRDQYNESNQKFGAAVGKF